jgi:hypothetical protein
MTRSNDLRSQPWFMRRVFWPTVPYLVASGGAYLVSVRYAHRYLARPWPQLCGVVAVIAIVGSIAYLRHRWLQRQRDFPLGMRCTRCGYNLRFNKGRCPECGTPCIASTGRFAEPIPVDPGDPL